MLRRVSPQFSAKLRTSDQPAPIHLSTSRAGASTIALTVASRGVLSFSPRHQLAGKAMLVWKTKETLSKQYVYIMLGSVLAFLSILALPIFFYKYRQLSQILSFRTQSILSSTSVLPLFHRREVQRSRMLMLECNLKRKRKKMSPSHRAHKTPQKRSRPEKSDIPQVEVQTANFQCSSASANPEVALVSSAVREKRRAQWPLP